ncbi:MAG: DoxX family protein [Phycisphaerae bacterium]|nr:DoxX family protein [Phycisphaerae bacterium]
MKAKNAVIHGWNSFNAWAKPVVLWLFLLLIRVIWGWAFFQSGRGKLHDIHKPIAFFTDLGIPFPTFNAWWVAILECVGGLLLLVGLASRPIALLLAGDMIVAYITADREALLALISDGDVPKFSAAAPFWFLVTSVLVLAMGPGLLSLDGLIFLARRKHPPSAFAKR